MQPLTPPEADLQDFPFMPLHVARLRDSDLAAEGHPEACWYAVLLWSASWHQLPAGSLPNNEAVLARLCGLGRDLKTFRRHRADAMRGWVLCDDGRLYHPVVAEQVNTSWLEKLAYRERKAKRTAIAEKAAKARWGESSDADNADASGMHEASEGDASCIAEAMPKGTGTGKGTGSYSEADASAGEPALDPAKVLFDSGIRLLASAGIAAPKARSLIGKWRKDHPDEAVISALGTAQREGAIDPVSFITKALEARNGKRSYHHRPDDQPHDPMVAAAAARLARNDPRRQGFVG